MNIENGHCLHIVLFGTFNERKYFLQDFRDSFDMVGFNANIIAHAPQGIAALVAMMSNKNYFIDPQFHAFQQPIRTIMRRKNNEWVVKESIRKLAEQYGNIITEKLGSASILAGTFNEVEKMELTKNIINFQWDVLEKVSEDQEYKDFLEFVDAHLRPQFLIAPYFFIEPDNFENEIYDNLSFVKLSRDYLNSDNDLKKEMLFAEIVIHKEVLSDKEMTKRIVDGYHNSEADGFILWIDNFVEVKETESLLKDYVKFLVQLKKNTGKPVMNFHGSYFSIFLASKAISLLAGVGHGIEYGESRPVIPVGGGIPLAKFYFPRFHKRIDYDPDASNILLEMNWIKDKNTYLENVCSCPVCKEVIVNDVMSDFQAFGETNISEKNGKAYPTPEAMDISRKHYLYNKTMEYNYCKKAEISQIIMRLSEAQNIAKNVEKIHPFYHLKKWINILKEFNY